VVALISLGNQFVNLAVRDLGENPVPLPNRQQDGIEHGIHAAHNLGVSSLKLLRLPAVGKLPFLRSVGQASHFLLQALHDDGDAVDRLLHLLVVALVSLGNQFVDFAVGNLGENPVPLPDRQQDGIQHFVDALHDFAIDPVKLVNPAAFGETALPRCVYQTHNLLRDEHHLAVPCFLCAAHPVAVPVSVPAATLTGTMRLSAFLYNFSRHTF